MALSLVLGLNPAWQRTLEFDKFLPGEVNRAKGIKLFAAGKGVNFARAAKIWDKTDCIVAQFAGGYPGLKLVGGLDEEGIKHLTRKVDTHTRICTTILSRTKPRMTELIEPSGKVAETDAVALLKAALAILAKADALAICGTYPPGVDENFYGIIAKQAFELDKFIMVDSVMATKQVLPFLKYGILKLNLDELRSLTKEDAPEDALRKCRTSYGIHAVAATDGPNKAYLSDESGIWTYKLPKLKCVESPLGAGDTCAAVTLSEFMAGTPAQEAFAFGLAAASASCLTRDCAVFSKESALEIKAQLHVKFAPQV